MEHYVGLDVSLKLTAICIVNRPVASLCCCAETLSLRDESGHSFCATGLVSTQSRPVVSAVISNLPPNTTRCHGSTVNTAGPCTLAVDGNVLTCAPLARS
jgi:hypothetical protein